METDSEIVLKAYADKCKNRRDAITQSLLSVNASENDELDENALNMVTSGMSNFRAILIVSDSIWDIYVLQKDSTNYSTQRICATFDIWEELDVKTFKGLTKLTKSLYIYGL